MQFVLRWHFCSLLGVHSVVKKVAQYMADVLEDSRDKVQENLLANGGMLMVTTLSVRIMFFKKKGKYNCIFNWGNAKNC